MSARIIPGEVWRHVRTGRTYRVQSCGLLRGTPGGPWGAAVTYVPHEAPARDAPLAERGPYTVTPADFLARMRICAQSAAPGSDGSGEG